MRRIGSNSVDGLIVRFVRTAHTMFFRRGRTIACTLVLATVLGAVEVGSARAGSVTIRTYQYNYRSVAAPVAPAFCARKITAACPWRPIVIVEIVITAI